MARKKISFIIIIFILSSLLSLALPIIKAATDTSNSGIASFDNVTDFINSNRYTQIEDTDIVNNIISINDKFETFETSLGTVYYSEESLAFMYVSDTGYIWSSYVKDYDDSWGNMNNTWEQRAESAIRLFYFDKNSTSQDETILTSKKTEVTVTKSVDKLSAHILFGTSSIELDMEILFTSSGIEVKIPENSIIENENVIESIQVYPFFGAVSNDMIPGYVFIPDGVGALVRYKKATGSSTNYEKEFYSRDITYLNQTDMNNVASNGANLSLPVYGFVHGANQNAVFANILSGSEYGYLNVYYPSTNLEYTTIFPQFIYRRKYNQPIDQQGTTIYLLQSERNKFDIDIKYTFLSGDDANYVGMANTYKEYLLSTGLKEKVNTSSNTPLLLETIGLEISSGEFFNDRDLVTSLKEYKSIVSSLNDSGITNITGIVNGFTNKGYSWSAPLYTTLSMSLGTKEDVEEIKQIVNELYFEVEYTKASSRSSGYSKYTDLAKRINMQNYTYGSGKNEQYLLTLESTLSLFNRSVKSLKKYSIDSLAISSLGTMIYGDYENNTTRSDLISTYQSMLDSDMNIGLYAPNAYLFNNLSAYFDADLYSSQYTTFDDTVPFISLALSGFFPIYSTNANFFANAKDELLRLVDYNVNLSFIVTEKSSSEFLESPLEYIYSSEYDSLKEAILIYYNYVNDALRNVINSSVIERTVLSSGVVLNKYDNNTSIVINYTNEDYIYGTVTIPAKDYEVIK